MNWSNMNKNEIKDLIDEMVEWYYEQGIVFENPYFLFNLKYIYIFEVEVPVFSHLSYNFGNP